jgi:hypothetical protein
MLETRSTISESILRKSFRLPFLRFQFPIANDDRKIADLVQHSARDLFDRTACSEHGETDKQIIFKPGRAMYALAVVRKSRCTA